MKPYKINIYLYAENEDQAKEAEKAAYEFVKDNYQNGVLVSALKVSEALRKFKNNFLVTNYLRN